MRGCRTGMMLDEINCVTPNPIAHMPIRIAKRCIPPVAQIVWASVRAAGPVEVSGTDRVRLCGRVKFPLHILATTRTFTTSGLFHKAFYTKFVVCSL